MDKMNACVDRWTYKFSHLNSDVLLENMILYIAEKCLEDPTFGATKLNKILFYSDFKSYFSYGEPVTGAAYQRLPQGPAPKRLVPIKERMIEESKIHIKPVKTFSYEREIIIPLKSADINKFKQRDIALVDDIIIALWGKTAKQVSAFSHTHFITNIAKVNELIPYEAVFISDEKITDYDISHAQDLINQNGWKV